MARREWLLYALGGGFGHLTRACALARAGLPDTQIRILTNSPYAAAVAHALPQLTISVDQGPAEILREIATAPADCLIVDTFPRGLVGELVKALPDFPGLKVLVQRDLNPQYAERYQLQAFIANSYDLVLVPGDTTLDGLGPFPQTVTTAPWLIRSRHELLSRDGARQILRLRDEKPCIVVCAAGNAAELAWYGAVVAQFLQRAPECDVRCIAPARPDACPPECWVAYWPAIDLYCAADIVIGGAGYNTIHECAACGVPLVAKAWPRKYDRQHLRAARAAGRADTPGDAVGTALQLLKAGLPKDRCLQFENGAANAIAAISLRTNSCVEPHRSRDTDITYNMAQIQALAASAPHAKLQPFSYDPGPLGDEQVEIEVQYCGICHSDLSMLNNDWQFTQYPFVPGHEAIGKVVAVGPHAKLVSVGQTVGLGWNSGSCLFCHQCLTGNHNMCVRLEQTIVGRYGAFGKRVRCHWCWATPIPEGVDLAKAGPLLCGGITVFNPLLQFDVRPTDRVGVIGIGGLGHMALLFLNKWGCDVTAFTSSASKADEARQMGAHHVIDTHSKEALGKAAGTFNFIISTVNVSLDWAAYLGALAPKGHLHIVGAVAEPLAVPAMSLLPQQHSVGGSPSGAPATVASMLDFCARHAISPITEEFPMSQANEAIAHLEAGKARYRIVLKNDL